MFICFQLLCNFPFFFFCPHAATSVLSSLALSFYWLASALFYCLCTQGALFTQSPIIIMVILIIFFFYYYSVLLRSVIRFCSLTLFWQFSLATHSRDFFFFVFFIFFIITLHCKYLTSQCRCRWQSQSLILSSLNVNVSAIYICCGCRATVFHIFIARLAERLHAAVSAH